MSILRFYCKEIGLSIEIPIELLNFLSNEGAKHSPNEFGGLLIGRYVENSKTCLIESAVLPKKFKSSRYYFERGKAGLKKKLIDYYNSNPRLFYVGEWHTHNSNSIAPSSVDMIAMQTIEEYTNLGIISPLLLIIGLDGDDYSIGFYIQYKKKLYKYECED